MRKKFCHCRLTSLTIVSYFDFCEYSKIQDLGEFNIALSLINKSCSKFYHIASFHGNKPIEHTKSVSK